MWSEQMYEGLSPVALTDEQVVLHKRQVQITQRLAPQMAHDLRASEWEDAFGHSVLALSSYVLTERLEDAGKSFTFSLFRSAWQRFKAEKLPNFVRWGLVPGVKYQDHTVRATVESEAWFPEASIITPDLGKPVYMRKVNWNVHPTSAL